MPDFSPQYFIIPAAFTIGIVLHLLQQYNNFVDNRKSILRHSLESKIIKEPYYLVLIQNIGKDCRTTQYFSEIVKGISPAYANLIGEIIELRERYKKTWKLGFYVYLILAFLLFRTLIIQQPISSEQILKILFLFAAFCIVGWLLYNTRLKETNISSKLEIGIALDYVLSNAYENTFKDRGYILGRNSESNKRFKERYETTAETIESIIKNFKREKNEQIDLSKIRILDIGCGDGQLELFLNEKLSVLGIDVSEASIEKARDNSKHRTNSLHQFKVENALKCEFEEKYFDIIILVEVLEHFISPEKHLKRFSKWLKSDGVLIATLPNTKSKYNRKIAAKNRPDIECDNIPKLSADGNELTIEHLWVDHTTKIRFPHRLYAKGAAYNVFDKIFKSVEVKPMVNGQNDQLTCDTFLIIARKTAT